MKNLNLLVVEGNLQKENENFRSSGIPTHAESLKESLKRRNPKESLKDNLVVLKKEDPRKNPNQRETRASLI